MVLQGWQCIGSQLKNNEGCGTIRGWGVFGYPPPEKDRHQAQLQCASCHTVTTHQYVPGHTIGLEWREYRS